MNTQTNELYDLSKHTPAEIEKLMAEAGDNLVEVPEELQHAANVKLAGKKYARVSLHSNGKLSTFARKKRKAKRKLTSKSRKANR